MQRHLSKISKQSKHHEAPQLSCLAHHGDSHSVFAHLKPEKSKINSCFMLFYNVYLGREGVFVRFSSLNHSRLPLLKGNAFEKRHILLKYRDMKLNSIIATISAGRKLGVPKLLLFLLSRKHLRIFMILIKGYFMCPCGNGILNFLVNKTTNK